MRRLRRLPELQHMTRASAIVDIDALKIVRMHQERQIDFKHFGNFARIGRGDEVRIDPRHYRQHPETGDCDHWIEKAQRRRKPMTQADFFMRFAKRGRDDIVIVGFDPAAGKTHLTRMMAQAVGAAGQQHLQAGTAWHQSHQHRRIHGRHIIEQVGQFIEIPRGR